MVKFLLILALLAVGSGVPVPAVGQDPGPDTNAFRQEYFVRQGANESLLIRINGLEAEFTSRVFDPDGEEITVAAVAGSRLAPVFHYISSSAGPRQLDIKVLSQSNTNRTRFDLELSRLIQRDSRSEQLALAYRYLSRGLQLTDDGSAAAWSVKINSLLNAAQIFDGFGMEEMRLWSMYYAALFAHAHLGDDNSALDFTEQVLTGVGLSRFKQVELATVQLEGEALASLRRAGSLPVPESGPDPVQSMLERAAGLASALGLQLERAWALYAAGKDFAGHPDNAQALERFGSALQIADSLDAGELSTLIREDMVAIHDLQGDVMASNEVLREIESQLSESGAVDELAENLLSQGRLLIRTYRYPEAIEVLGQALQHQRNSVIRAQANLELALAHYHSGSNDQALRHARAAVINPQNQNYRRPNPVIDVGAGLDVMAGVHRARGAFGEMRELRQAQQNYLAAGETAAWHYQRGLDRLAQGDSQGAVGRFQQSMRAADSGSQARWRHLSLLRICSLSAVAECTSSGLEGARTRLQAGGIPLDSARADQLMAGIQMNQGKVTAAAATMQGLMHDLLFFRRLLPGVLGAWYWQNREALFRNYLAMLGRLSRGESDGFRTLLGLNLTRHIEGTAGMERLPWNPGPELDVDLLRVMIARVDSPQAGENIARLAADIGAQLSRGQADFRMQTERLSEEGLGAWLGELGEEEAVLTWHIDAGEAMVILAHQNQVRRIPMRRAGDLASMLESARQQLGTGGGGDAVRILDQLGSDLLGQVARRLPAVIYFVPAGPLSGFPLDALRWEGRYLAENHQVVNMAAFPLGRNPGRIGQAGAPERVFLAGDPVDWSADFLTGLSSSAELQAVTRQFVGPGLTIVQGSALLPDEFTDNRFLNANLIHFAMPGYVDLTDPAGSSLELSEATGGLGRVRLGAASIRRWELQAELVFLSEIRIGGRPISAYDGRLGLVSDALNAGAGAVITSLWPQDGDAIALIEEFYSTLKETGDIPAALSMVKKRQIQAGEAGVPWARLQAYVD